MECEACSQFDFSALASMLLSGSPALPPLTFLMAILIYSIVGGVTSIESSVGAALIYYGFNGAVLFGCHP